MEVLHNLHGAHLSQYQVILICVEPIGETTSVGIQHFATFADDWLILT